MSRKFKEPPQSVRERTGRLLKMAGSLAAEELKRRLNSSEGPSLLLNFSQVQTLVQELAHLKGAAMKLGQMLALEARDYFPEEICQVLDQLQANASYLDSSVIHSILKTELGEKFKDFSGISRAPIAAASIGQVHTARLNSETNAESQVAIKVQYPGIRESIHSDVKVLGSLMKSVAILMRKQMNFDDLIEEFSEIFIQEADYQQESVLTQAYRARAEQVSHLIVPQVYTNYSSSRVLTLSYEPGLRLYDWLKQDQPRREMREFYGKLILDLYTREFCDWGLVQTDPNLGNFHFRPQQRSLVLLDFGATKAYDLAFRKQYSQLVVASLRGERKKILELGQQMQLISPQEGREARALFEELLFESMRPITLPEYDFGESDYPERMRKISRQFVQALKFSPPPRQLIFLHRKLSGIFYILRGLQVKLPLKVYTEKFEILAQGSEK
jgi:aarF domain-containing kinase